MAKRGKPNIGFTLVELLVVIAIIGMLIALLLPAVQSAREAARRTSCSNNLKQISLALLAFHNQERQFPLGVYSADTGRFVEDGLGWATKILPFVDEGPVFDRLVQNGIPGYDGNPWTPGIFRTAHAAGLTPIPGTDSVLSVFLCPSTNLPERVPQSDYFGETGKLATTGSGTSSYKGSRGYYDRGMFWRVEEGLKTRTFTVDYDGDGTPESVYKGAYTRVRIDDVPDGTSHTIAVGEASYFTSWGDYPIWAGAAKEDGAVLFKTENPIGCNISGARSFPLSPAEISKLPSGATDDCAFSWHLGGAYFAFVDGSVHFMSENLQQRVYYLLGDRMDNQPLPNVD